MRRVRQSFKSPRRLGERFRTLDDTEPLSNAANLIVSAKAIWAAAIAGLGYYLGWRFVSSYYGNFGLDPVFFDFTPTDIVFSGWRIFIITFGICVIAVFLRSYGTQVAGNLIATNSLNLGIYSVLILLALGAGIGVFVTYQHFVYGAQHTILRYLLVAFSLALLSLAITIGDRLDTTIEARKKSLPKLLISFYSLLFPNPITWFLASLLYGLFFLSIYTSWYGYTYSLRDLYPDSRLQTITIDLNQEAGIPDGKPIREGVWRYDRLRLLHKAHGMYFIFRIEEVQDEIVTLYAIPEAQVVGLELRPWFYAPANP